MTRNKELIVPRGMEASKMSWMALPVAPACMGKVGEGTRRPPMFVGLAEQIKLQCSDIIKVKITI